MMRSANILLVVIFALGCMYGIVGVFWRPVFSGHLGRIEQRCQKSTTTQTIACIRHELDRLTRMSNFSRILSLLEQQSGTIGLSLQEPGDVFSCHAVAHISGEVAALKYPTRGIELVDACKSKCGYGCVHGVVMGLMKKNASAYDSLAALCTTNDKRLVTVSNQIACYHGLGHGLAEYAGYDIRQAMQYCSTFADVDAQEECKTGVFMEIYSPVDSNHTPLPLPEDLFVFCSDGNKRAQIFCRRMMVASWYRIHKDAAKSFSLCYTALPVNKEECVLTVGAEIFFIEDEDVAKIMLQCDLAQLHRTSCIQGVVLSSLTIYQDRQKAYDICQHADDVDVAGCVSYVKQRLQTLNIP